MLDAIFRCVFVEQYCVNAISYRTAHVSIDTVAYHDAIFFADIGRLQCVFKDKRIWFFYTGHFRIGYGLEVMPDFSIVDFTKLHLMKTIGDDMQPVFPTEIIENLNCAVKQVIVLGKMLNVRFRQFLDYFVVCRVPEQVKSIPDPAVTQLGLRDLLMPIPFPVQQVQRYIMLKKRIERHRNPMSGEHPLKCKRRIPLKIPECVVKVKKD